MTVMFHAQLAGVVVQCRVYAYTKQSEYMRKETIEPKLIKHMARETGLCGGILFPGRTYGNELIGEVVHPVKVVGVPKMHASAYR
jgi:hypothetical protein